MRFTFSRPLTAGPSNTDISTRQMKYCGPEVLSVLQDPEAPFVIVSYPDALAEKVISRDDLKKNTLKISVGEKLDNMFVSDVLDEYGFEQVDYVYEPGQYALRGSILDVFSFSYEFPYRIIFSRKGSGDNLYVRCGNPAFQRETGEYLYRAGNE